MFRPAYPLNAPLSCMLASVDMQIFAGIARLS